MASSAALGALRVARPVEGNGVPLVAPFPAAEQGLRCFKGTEAIRPGRRSHRADGTESPHHAELEPRAFLILIQMIILC